MKKTLTAFAAAMVLALAFSTAAFGQSSTEEGYNPTGPEVVNKVEDENEAQAPAATNQAAANDDGDELPFTGLDLALLAGAGGMLLALGVGMRRLTRSPESA